MARGAGVVVLGVGLCVFASICMSSAAQGQAGKCTPQYRELLGVNGLPEMLEQDCALGGAQGLRVSFVRLNEPLVGSLVLHEPVPELQSLLESAVLVDNDVAGELTRIFRQFAKKVVEPAGNVTFTINVRAPGAPWRSVKLPAVNARGSSVRRIWSLSSPFGDAERQAQFPIFLKSADQVIKSSRKWPAEFKQFYTCQFDAVSCTRLWRYLDVKELDQIEKDTQERFKRAEERVGVTERSRSMGVGSTWPNQLAQFKGRTRRAGDCNRMPPARRAE